jgi:hypothetical protein
MTTNEEMKQKRDENITLEKIGNENEITDEELNYFGSAPRDWYPEGPGIYLEHHKKFNTPLKVYVLINEHRLEYDVCTGA